MSSLAFISIFTNSNRLCLDWESLPADSVNIWFKDQRESTKGSSHGGIDGSAVHEDRTSMMYNMYVQKVTVLRFLTVESLRGVCYW